MLGAAFAAALLTGPQVGPISGTVEGLASSSSTILQKLALNLPVGYAVGAGMVAAVNPCGFPMLPAYLGLYLGTEEASGLKPGIGRRLARAIGLSLTMTAAFMLLFAGVGIVLGRGLHTVTNALPLAGLAVGVIMVIIAGRMLAGGTLHLSLGERMADRLGSRARTAGIGGYFAYGLAYGLVSLSCTLPIFLVVVGSAATSAGLGAALSQFLLYAAGMGLVITVLTVSVGLLRNAARSIRLFLPYVQPLSAALLLLAGAYLVYYWLTIGGILRTGL